MSARPLAARGLAVIAALGVSLLVAGCSSDLKIEPFPQADSAACLSASQEWPTSVQSLERRVVAVQTPSVAAWGDPEVIARCGATPPGPTTASCYDIDGVHWVETELDDGWAYTTYGRDPAIQVLIPADYNPALWLLPAFAPAAEEIEATRFCSGLDDLDPGGGSPAEEDPAGQDPSAPAG